MNLMPDLKDKVAIITGAKGGLGTHVTGAFLAEGATVIGVSRSIAPSDFPGPGFVATPAELATGDAARSLVKNILDRFRRIDVLVHLVGGFAGGAPVAETDDATFERMLQINLRSAFYM